MAIESPLFQSAMELLGHSVTHFAGRDEIDRKLFILHVCNAVELLLKDMRLDTGESIYKNPKETVSVTHCIEALKNKGVTLPLLNRIELLIDERNALQHRFGSPNELTSIFYQKIAFAFFGSVLKDHYSLELDEMLDQFAEPRALASLRLSEPSNDSELQKLKKYAGLHPLGALLAVDSYLQRVVMEFIGKIDPQGTDRLRGKTTDRLLAMYEVPVPLELDRQLGAFRTTRNMAAHGQLSPSEDVVLKAIATVEELEETLAKADLDALRKLQTQSARPAERAKRQWSPFTNSEPLGDYPVSIVLLPAGAATMGPFIEAVRCHAPDLQLFVTTLVAGGVEVQFPHPGIPAEKIRAATQASAVEISHFK